MALRALTALLALALAAPARAGFGVDVREDAIRVLKEKKNAPAAEAAAFLSAHPEVKIVMATKAELGGEKFDLISGVYDFKFDTIFLVENAKENLAVRGEDGRYSRERLDLFLDVRAPTLVHEASHAAVVKQFRFPVAGILQDELLAHVRQARYLEKELTLTPELTRAVENYRRILLLEAAGGSPALPALRQRYEHDRDELTATAIHLALVLKEYRSGPRAFARYLRLRYGPSKGFWSVFGRPGPAIARIEGEMENAATETARESAIIQLGFWNDAKRLAEARKYYSRMLPEYRDMRWPSQE